VCKEKEKLFGNAKKKICKGLYEKKVMIYEQSSKAQYYNVQTRLSFYTLNFGLRTLQTYPVLVQFTIHHKSQ
jgi:hypothetical protein